MIDTDIDLSAVDSIAEEFAPDVVRILTKIEPEWLGDPTIIFKVLVPDTTTVEFAGKLRQTLTDRMQDVLQLKEFGYWPLFSFRTVSEQQALNDPAWR